MQIPSNLQANLRTSQHKSQQQQMTKKHEVNTSQVDKIIYTHTIHVWYIYLPLIVFIGKLW